MTEEMCFWKRLDMYILCEATAIEPYYYPGVWKKRVRLLELLDVLKLGVRHCWGYIMLFRSILALLVNERLWRFLVEEGKTLEQEQR